MLKDEYFFTSFFYNWIVEPHLRGIKRYTAKICKERGVRIVADICCGTGTQCYLLAANDIKCVGIDLSPGMLKIANKKKPNNTWFIRMDSGNLAFKNNKFDAAIISFALHEKSYSVRQKIAKETKRIVKRGGIVLVADYLVEPETGIPDWKTRFVEFMAGQEHFRCFTDFCERGGLAGVANLFGLQGKVLETFRNNSWGLLLLENS